MTLEVEPLLTNGSEVAVRTAEELMERASVLVPTLRERSARCEELRRILPETVNDVIAAGFLRIAQPVRFGGMGLGIDTVGEVAMEIGRGCGSTAWMVGQWPGHNFMVGLLPERAQEEYWERTPDMLSSTASAVVKLDFDQVSGGLEVSGLLKFSSGVDWAEWLLLLTPVALCLVPKSDFQIVDDWHVMGLRGTGSKSVSLESAFVPQHRMVSLEALMSGRSFGADLYPDNPFYRVPFNIVLNTLLLTPTVGMARGLLDIFEQRALGRTDTHTHTPAFERPGTQLRFGEASAEVDTAVLLVREVYSDLVRLGSSGQDSTITDRARNRRNIAYAAKLCLQSANRVLESGDASGMFDEQLLQRWGRDIHMAGLQVNLTWDDPAMSYSQSRWGLSPQSRMT